MPAQGLDRLFGDENHDKDLAALAGKETLKPSFRDKFRQLKPGERLDYPDNRFIRLSSGGLCYDVVQVTEYHKPYQAGDPDVPAIEGVQVTNESAEIRENVLATYFKSVDEAEAWINNNQK